MALADNTPTAPVHPPTSAKKIRIAAGSKGGGTFGCPLRDAIVQRARGVCNMRRNRVLQWHGGCLGVLVKMFDLAWYLEWEEGEGAPTWGKMWVFIDNPRLCSLFTV